MKRWKSVIWTLKTDCPTESSDFISPIPWKQISYFWSLRDCMSSWCHSESCLWWFYWQSHPGRGTEPCDPTVWSCILCCCAALSCHTANCHRKEAQHLAEIMFCQIGEVLSSHWATSIAETLRAAPAGAHVCSLLLLGTDLNKIPFDRYWENKMSWSASLQRWWKQRSRRQTCQEIMWNHFLLPVLKTL